MAKKSTENKAKITSVIAKESDGNIQITFTLPYALVQMAQNETVAEMAKDIEIPGFRKGNAPLTKVREKISEGTLIEHALSHILPKALAETINEKKLKIAIYPKFELIKATENEPWQVRGITCELPEIVLGDYKKNVQGVVRAKSLWTPAKGAPEKPKELTREEKEQLTVKALTESIQITIPKILIDEEISNRLSNLLGRLEKLGLALEGYLASIGKTVDSIRAEYETQAKEAIALDLILSKIAEVEGIKSDEKEVEEALKVSVSSTSPSVESKEDIESRKRLIESILRRRKALDFLTNLV